MSSEPTTLPTKELTGELVRRIDLALESTELEEVGDAEFGELFAAMVRLLAAKAQAGHIPVTSSGNSTFTSTDGVIACTAILETAGVEVFELSAWQALSNVGSRRARY